MSEKGESPSESRLGIDDVILDVIRDQKPRRTLLHRGMPPDSELENLDPQTIQEITEDNFYALSQRTGKIVKLSPGERAQGHGNFNEELPENSRRKFKLQKIIARRKAK